ncbi:PREDICTED: tetratricopeptide repeat protein 1 [Polistes dominula]|uniref:Tetratricopeptide repeat protein 1 n=1 Tax=Polistes dominula TaxID=743375 RepID=A0ABM1HSU3_POLDO|nr:PREDICTED: tetratricopeptide repeat protein 1 [Polistes dominula]
MDNNCSNIKTNEEIIEELTRDLENSINVDDDENPITKETRYQTSEINKSSSSEESNQDFINRDDSNGNEKNDNADSKKTNADSIDEEFLKKREENLSETEKETLKDEAEKLKNEGNTSFKDGDYVKAISLYTQGLQTCPLTYSKERAILYSNRAAAKIKSLDEKESAISDCTKAIELNPSYVKAYIRRAQLYEETDKLDESLEDYKKILTFDPSHSEANYAVRRLPPLINERNEKLKTEMLGKLKDLGNMVLKPFGLSTNNFELQKDPNSGGYSVKFHQTPR